MYGDKNAFNVRDPETAVYADISEIPTMGELVAMKDKVEVALNTIQYVNEQQKAAQAAQAAEKGETVNE